MHILDTPSSQFLIGLALKKQNNSTNSPDIKDVDEIFELVNAFFKNYYFTIFPLSRRKHTEDEITSKARTQYLISQINHERYVFQTTELINEIFGNLDDYFLDNWGFTITDALSFSHKIIQYYTQNIREKLSRCSQYEGESKDREIFSHNKDIFKIVPEDFCTKMNIENPIIFSNYLNALSSEFGGCNQTYESPLDENHLFKKPIIKFENTYYAPIPEELIQNLPAIFEFLLEKEKNTNTKNWRKFLDKKSEYTEKKVTECINRIFLKKDVYENLFYNFKGSRFEVDNIIPYCNNVIIIETKSGTFSDSAKRGGIKRITTDIKRLIGDAYEQGLRVRQYITNSSIAEFKDSKGKLRLQLRNDSNTNFIFINVTLEPLTSFSTSLKQFENLGIFNNKEYPWSVNLFDLDIITSYFDSPAIFIHYIESRLEVQDKESIGSPDELSYFGFYLKFGTFNIRYYEGKKVDWIMLEPSFLDKFDQHYLFGKDPPILEIEPEILRIVKDLEKLRPDNFTEITNAILNLDHTSRKDLINTINERIFKSQTDGKLHDYTFLDKENKQGITIFSQIGREELAEKLVVYCTLKKYQCKSNLWIGLGINVLDDSYLINEYFFDNSKWRRDSKKERTLKWAIDKKMIRPEPDLKLK